MQNSLFVRDAECSDSLRVPKFTQTECTLGYREYEEVPRGLGVMDDTPFTMREFTIPVVVGHDKNGKELQFCFSTQQYHEGGPEMVNAWMKSEHAKYYPQVADWIKKNADELNYARRYYKAKNLERFVRETEEELQRAKVALNIEILQAKEDRWIFGEERKKLTIEFGGSLEE